MKIFKDFQAWQLILLLCLGACQPVGHNTAELIDPWLRDRTLESVRLAGQVGTSIISTDWRDDAHGTITLNLIVNSIDLSAVRVEEIVLKDLGEYTPTASVKAGDTIDLSDGQGEIVVTAFNGETRTYIISYSGTTLFNGTFAFAAEKSSLTWGDATYCFLAGGPDADVRTGNIYDHLGAAWNKDEGRWPNDELDNVVSFKQTYYDQDNNCQYGTFLNLPGEDGLYANFVYREVPEDEPENAFEKDCNSIYRLIPQGKGRWSNEVGSDVFAFYDYSDDTYSNPVGEVQLLQAGTYTIEYPGATVATSWCPGTITVADVAFTRLYTYDSYVDHGDLVASFMADNVRQVWWLMTRTSDGYLDNHDEMIAQIQ